MISDLSVVPIPEKIPGYNLDAPTEATARRSFERVLGSEEADAVWNRARMDAGFASPDKALTLEQLRLVAEILAGREGFAGILGVSLRIRIDTFQSLSSFATQAQQPDSGTDLA